MTQFADERRGRVTIAESVVHAAQREAQIDAFARLRQLLHVAGSSVQLVADEWCNTLDDVSAFLASEAADMLPRLSPTRRHAGRRRIPPDF